MKKIFISCVLVVWSVSVWAQTTKPNTTKKPTTKTETAKEQTAPPVVVVPPVVPPPAPFPAPKQQDRPTDGYFKKNNVPQAKLTPLAPIREADVIFSRRVWRDIDVREKLNQFFVAPQSRLIDLIYKAVAAGELTAYDPTAAPEKDDRNGDAFSTPLTPEKAIARFTDSTFVEDYDANGDVIQGSGRMVANIFTPDSILKFRIKEDWVFDKQRSVFEPRIIGIAPLIKIKKAGQELNEQPIFWVYFPELRPLLNITQVANGRNDAFALSFDDVFMKRIFASYIVKVSNVKDEYIRDYTKTGVDRLKESERLKKELLDWEHDLWSY